MCFVLFLFPWHCPQVNPTTNTNLQRDKYKSARCNLLKRNVQLQLHEPNNKNAIANSGRKLIMFFNCLPERA